jgi:hypothetical protein
MRHLVAAFVVEVLLVVGNAFGLRNGTRPECVAEPVIEVHQVGVLEPFPRRQRDVVPVGRQFIIDDPALAKGAAVHVDGPFHLVWPGVHHGVDDGAAARVSHQDHLSLDGVHRSRDGNNVLVKADPGTVGIHAFKPRQSQGMRAVSCGLERRRHLLPGGSVQPEAGNQDDVHDGTLLRPAQGRPRSIESGLRQSRGSARWRAAVKSGSSP